jgi:acyl carrier protein
MTISEKVINIVAEKLNQDKSKVVPSASFINDLGADSLDIVELVMELEKEYGMVIPDDATEKMLTVGDAIKFIEDHSKNAKPAA